MLDPFDYKEPRCALCGGEEFYYPDSDAPEGHIPVDRVIEKLDMLLNRNDMDGAGRLLRSWRDEAIALKDKNGELAILSEMMGYYRKTKEKERGLESVKRGLKLIDELGLKGGVSAATITLNAATTLKAFGKAEEALPYYEEVLKIYREQLKPDDPKIAGLYNNYALTLVDLKEFDKAEKLYFDAIEILKNVKDGENDIAVTYVNLAHMYDDKSGDEDKIDECMNKAYEYLNSDKLTQNGYHAYVCSKCAPSFAYFGYFLIDEELRKRSEELYARN